MKDNKFYGTLLAGLNGGFMELITDIFWFIVIMGGTVAILFIPIMWLISPLLYRAEIKRLNALNESLMRELSLSNHAIDEYRYAQERQDEQFMELQEACRGVLFPRNRYLRTHESNLGNLYTTYRKVFGWFL